MPCAVSQGPHPEMIAECIKLCDFFVYFWAHGNPPATTAHIAPLARLSATLFQTIRACTAGPATRPAAHPPPSRRRMRRTRCNRDAARFGVNASRVRACDSASMRHVSEHVHSKHRDFSRPQGRRQAGKLAPTGHLPPHAPGEGHDREV